MRITKTTEEITLEDGYRATIRRQDGQIEEIIMADASARVLFAAPPLALLRAAALLQAQGAPAQVCPDHGDTGMGPDTGYLCPTCEPQRAAQALERRRPRCGSDQGRGPCLLWEGHGGAHVSNAEMEERRKNRGASASAQVG